MYFPLGFLIYIVKQTVGYLFPLEVFGEMRSSIWYKVEEWDGFCSGLKILEAAVALADAIRKKGKNI